MFQIHSTCELQNFTNSLYLWASKLYKITPLVSFKMLQVHSTCEFQNVTNSLYLWVQNATNSLHLWVSKYSKFTPLVSIKIFQIHSTCEFQNVTNSLFFYQELLKEKSNPRLKGNRKEIIAKLFKFTLLASFKMIQIHFPCEFQNVPNFYALNSCIL